MADAKRILIADDHPIFRQGLRHLFDSEKAFEVIAEAGDGLTALREIEAQRPDVAILDLDMPEMDGFAVARSVKEKQLGVELVFLTMYKDEEMFNEALDLGVKAYVLKDSAVTDLIGAVRAVLAGSNFISPSLSSHLINRHSKANALERSKPGLKDLTPTERRILPLIAENKTSREIADALFISVRTVDNHRSNICQKLDLHGAHALLKFALEHKSKLT
jgi:DNA-binding NarL/FixJ family response regulator